MSIHPSSNYFSFDRFCIYAYDGDGNTQTEKNDIPDGYVINYTATPVSSYRHPKNTGEIKVNATDPDATNAKIMEEIKII